MNELWDILDENGNKTGRTVERGKPMGEGEYHLCVYVWITNNNGEFLIAKRSPSKKESPDMWECVGGNAVSGDDSLTTALKEVSEEIGITLMPQNGRLMKHFKRRNLNGDESFADVWLFKQEVDIADVVLCSGETCDAKWASCDEISRMIDERVFVTWETFSDLNELLELFDSAASTSEEGK